MLENDTLESDIQSETFHHTAKILLVVGYIWFITVSYPLRDVEHTPAAWLGSLALLAFPVLSLKLYQRFPNIAPFFLLCGACLSITAAMIEYRFADTGYLFVLPIIFSGIFLHRLGTFLLVILSMLGVLIGQSNIPGSSIGFENLFQVLILIISGVASSISAARLYLALNWAHLSYERARENEQIVVGQRAELIRVLKEVDKLNYQYERAIYSLQLERDRSEEARRLKQQFAQNISHELRTPLSLIVGFSQLMLESPEQYGLPITPSFVRDLGIIHRNARHLQSLTDDVLELAGVDAGKLSLAMDWIDPVEQVHDVITTVSGLVRQRGLELKLITGPAVPRIWADPARTRQVLYNLLNNAIRFTEHGAITLRIQPQGDDVVFSVQDTGIGIPQEMRTHIFEEFVQVKEKGKNRGGSGLGLAISRRFVEMHSGRIWVESQLGVGSTFFFSLPIAHKAYAAPALPDRVQPLAPAGSQDRKDAILLVATSSPSIASLLNHRLKGGRTVVVKDFSQIELVAKALCPQAILLDCAGENRVEPALVEGLVSLGIPLIVCTLPGEGKIIDDLQIDSYLTKPVTREMVLDVLRQLGGDVNKILIADEDHDFIQLFSRFLNLPARPYQVTMAETRDELIELLSMQPDLVILGLDLPKPELARLVNEIRAKSSHPESLHIIIIAQNEDSVWGNPFPEPITIRVQGGMQPATFVQVVQEIMDTALKTS